MMAGGLFLIESTPGNVGSLFADGPQLNGTEDVSTGLNNKTDGHNGLAAVTLVLKQIVPPFFIVLGTTGNVLGIILLQRSRRLRRMSVAYYLRLFLVTSTFVLFFGSGQDWLCSVTRLPFIWDIADSLCRLWEFFANSLFYYPIWLVVAMLADRYLSVSGSSYKNTFCNLFFAKIVAIGILVSLGAVSVHALWTFELHRKYGCSIPAKRRDFHSVVWPWISAIMYSFLPPCLIMVFTLMLTIAMCNKRKRLEGDPSNMSERSSADNHVESSADNSVEYSADSSGESGADIPAESSTDDLTMASIIVALICLICTTPATTMNVFMMKVPTSWIKGKTTVFELELVTEIFQLLAVVNHAVMSFACLATSPLLRREAYNVFIKKSENVSVKGTEYGLVSFCNETNGIMSSKVTQL